MCPYRTFSIDGFQIIESEDTFLFKNEISSPATSGIRQNIDAITMLYSLARRINQIVEVITFFADSAEDIRFTLYGMEFAEYTLVGSAVYSR